MDVAETVGAEIVSIDSTAIYRGMNIGTDKPTPEMRARVPHHLVDVRDPADTVTVAGFQSLAREAIHLICARGAIPLLVGGSGLYFRAVVDPLEFPGTDTSVRRRIEERAEREGAMATYDRLAQADPDAASRIEPNNVRRVIRALEVIEVSGRPFSSFRTGWDSYESIYDLHVAGLTHPRHELDERIDERVERQVAMGLFEEVALLDEQGMRASLTSVQALGYAQVLQHLDGLIGRQEAIDEIKRRTRKFARRQLSWFGADPRIAWFGSDLQGAKRFLIEKGEA